MLTPILLAHSDQEEISCRDAKPLKLVDYKDDDDDEEPATSLKEGDLIDQASSPVSSDHPPKEDEEDLKLPVREKKEEDESKSFFAGVSAQKSSKTTKNVRSPQYKNMFQKISWKQGSDNDKSSKPVQEPNGDVTHDSNSNSVGEDALHDLSAESGETSALIAKRKLELEEAQTADSILKKSKTGTPISSS